MQAARLRARRAGGENDLRSHPSRGRNQARSRASRPPCAGSGGAGEWVLRRKDGNLITTEVSANILPDGRWQAFVRDITERKRVEDERRVFASLLDNSPDFVAVADPAAKGRSTSTRLAAEWSGCRPMFRSSRDRDRGLLSTGARSFVRDVILKTTMRARLLVGRDLLSEYQDARADSRLAVRFRDTRPQR